MVRAALFEIQVRAGDQILNGVRRQHLSRLGERGDRGADFHCDAANLIAKDVAQSGMQHDPAVDAGAERSIANRCCATNRAHWSIEGGDEPWRRDRY